MYVTKRVLNLKMDEYVMYEEGQRKVLRRRYGEIMGKNERKWHIAPTPNNGSRSGN